MSISKETELIIKLKHLPGFGPKNVDLVAKAMIEHNLFSDNDIGKQSRLTATIPILIFGILFIIKLPFFIMLYLFHKFHLLHCLYLHLHEL